MTKRKLRNQLPRRKAFFGLGTEGAILAAAGINALATTAGAALSAKSTRDSAKQQAAATITNAQKQAEAIKEQTERSNEYQLQSQEFIKQENEQNRQLQRDIQLSLQMLAGQQDVDDRLEASKIKVKYGGSTRINRLNNVGKRHLRKAIKAYNNEDYDNIDYDILERARLIDPTDSQIFRPRRLKAKYGQSSLRGSYNMPFKVTDGGGVILRGITPEGFELYELYGNDHEHYHKAQGGKYKSGVGIKFADGNVVEGEGNQKSSKGELMAVTPEGAFFISKHNIGGINPEKLVENGVHPLQAYAIQETQKELTGVENDYNSRQTALLGGMAGMYDNIYKLNPQVGTDTVGDTAVGVAYGFQNKPRLKYGGGCRVKAARGLSYFRNFDGDGLPHLMDEVTVYPSPGPSNAFTNIKNHVASNISPIANAIHNIKLNPTGTSIGTRGLSSDGTAAIGAGINAVGNILGGFISSAGNRAASNILSGAYNTASRTLANAYNSLRTIDMNSLRRQDFSAAHAMPVIQAPISQAESKITGVNRDLERKLSNIRKNSTSSAAAGTRANVAGLNAQDLRNKVYAQDQAQMQQIRQANAQRISDAAVENAKLDVEANKNYTDSNLALLQYNNEIENQKILGAAGALSEGAVNSANAIAQARAANGQTWANSLLQSTSGFANTLSAMAKRKADYENVLFGADTGHQVNAVILKNDRENASTMYDTFKNMANDPTVNANDRKTYANYAALLRNKFGFKS